MTKIIGLTGGIGSGKTTIGNFFQELGIPVYVADDEGRKITDLPEVIRQIQAVFGDAVIENGMVNRKKLSEIVFNDEKKLAQLNEIIHPAVKAHFANWIKKYTDSPFVIRESAILFESGSATDCDYIITVTAPLENRIERVVQRDQSSRSAVMSRIANQMTDEERISKSDFVIENTACDEAKKQAVKILKKLTNRQKTD